MRINLIYSRVCNPDGAWWAADAWMQPMHAWSMMQPGMMMQPRPGRKYSIKGRQRFYLKKYVIIRFCSCENRVDLEDLQNTLDWSWSGYQMYIFLESSQETLQVCPWNHLAFGTSRETLDTSRGCSNIAAGGYWARTRWKWIRSSMVTPVCAHAGFDSMGCGCKSACCKRINRVTGHLWTGLRN